MVGTAEPPARHPLGGRAASPDPWRQRAGDIAAASGCWGWVVGLVFFFLPPPSIFFLLITSWFVVGGSWEAHSDSRLSDRRERRRHCSLINYIVASEETKKRARRFLIG